MRHTALALMVLLGITSVTPAMAQPKPLLDDPELSRLDQILAAVNFEKLVCSDKYDIDKANFNRALEKHGIKYGEEISEKDITIVTIVVNNLSEHDDGTYCDVIAENYEMFITRK